MSFKINYEALESTKEPRFYKYSQRISLTKVRRLLSRVEYDKLSTIRKIWLVLLIILSLILAIISQAIVYVNSGLDMVAIVLIVSLFFLAILVFLDIQSVAEPAWEKFADDNKWEILLSENNQIPINAKKDMAKLFDAPYPEEIMFSSFIDADIGGQLAILFAFDLTPWAKTRTLFTGFCTYLKGDVPELLVSSIWQDKFSSKEELSVHIEKPSYLSKEVSLEGHFRDFFRTYTTTEADTLVRVVLTPDVMHKMIEHGPDLFFYFNNQRLYILGVGDLRNTKDLPKFISNSHIIYEDVNHNIRRKRSPVQVTATTPKPVPN